MYLLVQATYSDSIRALIPLPDSSVTSVTNLIPYRKYPYPTEHTLVSFKIQTILKFKITFEFTLLMGVAADTRNSQRFHTRLHLENSPSLETWSASVERSTTFPLTRSNVE